jgi:hypothetical protein
MEKVQKCEVQEQSYVPSPESFKVYLLYEVLLLFVVYAIFDTVICVFFYLLVFCSCAVFLRVFWVFSCLCVCLQTET